MAEVIRPGTIGLTQISGTTGKLIRFGQWLNGNGFADYQHAFVATSVAPDTKSGQQATIIEAEPGGARIRYASEYSDVYWCKNIAAWAGDRLNGVAEIALQDIGVPYSFLDYASLAAHRLHIPAPGLKSYIASTKHMICSQLADQIYQDLGCELFGHDWPGYVTPLDFYNLDRTLAGPPE